MGAFSCLSLALARAIISLTLYYPPTLSENEALASGKQALTLGLVVGSTPPQLLVSCHTWHMWATATEYVWLLNHYIQQIVVLSCVGAKPFHRECEGWPTLAHLLSK